MSTPLAIATGTITGQAVNGQGVAVQGLTITAKLMAGFSVPQSIAPAGQIIPGEVSTQTDQNGFWSLSLVPNNNISPANTTWLVSVPGHPDVLIQLNDTASHAYLSLAVGSTGATLAPAGQTVTGLLALLGGLNVTGAAKFAGLDPWIDLTHPAYGGVGDGITDNSPAFVNAIAQLPASGGTIFVPPGTYVCNSAISLAGKNFVRIRGGGPTGTGGSATATLIKFTGLIGPLIAASGTTGIELEDLYVQWANTYTGTVVDFSTTTFARVRRCFFATTSGSTAALGIGLDSSTRVIIEQSAIHNVKICVQGLSNAAHFSNVVIIRECTFSSSTGDVQTAHIDSPGQDWVIEANAFEMGQGAGNCALVATTNSSGPGVKFEGNWVGDQGANAVTQITAGNGWTIAGNYLGGAAAVTCIGVPNNASGISIHGNEFATYSVAVAVGASVSNIQIGPNDRSGVTTYVTGIPTSGGLLLTNGTTVHYGATQVQGDMSFDRGIGPGTPAVGTQAGRMYMGSGVPSNANGNNGDFYFRIDTPGTVNQRLYNKQAGTWTGIL